MKIIQIIFLSCGISLGAVEQPETTVIAALPDGRKVVLRQETSEVVRNGTEKPNVGNPSIVEGVVGKIPTVQFTIEMNDGITNRVIWKRTMVISLEPVLGAAVRRPKVYDFAVKDNMAAVLYSDRDVYLDVFQIGLTNKTPTRIGICAQGSSLEFIMGRIVWGTGLYVVGELRSDLLWPVMFSADGGAARQLLPAEGNFVPKTK